MLETPFHRTESTDQLPPPMSKRFEAVVGYLEEAAKIVPLESVFYAITHSNDDTALKCGKALQSNPNLVFPASQMMFYGSKRAADRMLLGEEFLKQQSQPVSIPALDFPFLLPSFVSPQEHMFSPSSHQQTFTEPLPSFLSGQEHTFSSSSPQQMHTDSLPSIQKHVRTFPSSPSLQPHTDPLVSHSSSSRAANGKPSYSDVARLGIPPHYLHSELQRVVQVPVAVPIPIMAAQPSPLDENVGYFLRELFIKIQLKCFRMVMSSQLVPVLSRKSIEHFCPFSPRRETVSDTNLKSPVQALIDARKHLIELVRELSLMQDIQSAIDINKKMSQKVKNIQENVVNVCAALLASFMEQQIQIPLLSSHISTAAALSTISPVVMGAWAFVSMGRKQIADVLSSAEGQSFKIEIEDYISTLLQHNAKEKRKSRTSRESRQERSYADKLGFLVGGIKEGPTVTCSEEYISYSLECQLKKLSEQLKFDKLVNVKDLVKSWDVVFKKNALSLVAETHRPLIARWLKWSLLTHDLRETLAKHLCVAVIGISNSGKSLLVNSLFKTRVSLQIHFDYCIPKVFFFAYAHK